MDAEDATDRGNDENCGTKKKPQKKKKAGAVTSQMTTKISNTADPEKKKSPSKRRSVVKPMRKPKVQGYYRRRLEFFDSKQNGTKEDVSAFLDIANDGLDMVPKVMAGATHIGQLFPLYKAAIDKYLDASLKLRQTILTERKLAAEVWGDNSIASYADGVYTVAKGVINDLLRPKSDDLSHIQSADLKTKNSVKSAKKRKISTSKF